MADPSSQRSSEHILKDFTWLLHQQAWIPEPRTLFRTGERIGFHLDISEMSIPASEVCTRLQEDPGLLDLIIQYVVRLHLDAFRAVTLTLAGIPLKRTKPPRVICDASELRFTISPDTVYMLNREYYRWSRMEEEKDSDEEPQPQEVEPITRMQNHVKAIPTLTPMEMNAELERQGYCGQPQARRAVCLFAYRHLRRIQAVFLEGRPLSELPPKENLLLQGPTGCGKTYLLETLFRHVLKLPVAIVDVSAISEAGYAGHSTEMIPQQLIQAAGGDQDLASIGVICLDEFDKLAGHSDGSRDVNGFGVQRELLKMIEGSELPPSWKERRNRGVSFSTRCVPFVAAGAFSRMEKLKTTLKRKQSSIGFESGAQHETLPSVHESELLRRYGFIPELIGRFGRFAEVEPMNADLLCAILDEQVVRRYRAECEREGVGLHISPAVRRKLVETCLASRTGARGLATALNTHLEEACYLAFSSECNKVDIHFRLERGDIQCRVRE